MTQALRCINPTCDYIFSAGEIRGAAALACPLCGNVIQLSAGAAPPPAPRPVPPPPHVDPNTMAYQPAPVAQRVEEEYVATRVDSYATTEYAPSGYAPVEEPSPFEDDAVVSHDSLQRRRQPGMSLWKQVVLITALGSILVGLPVMAILFGLFSHQQIIQGSLEKPFGFNGFLYNEKGAKEIAFHLGVPPDVWKEHDEWKDHFKAAVALEREYQDPKTNETVLIVMAVAGQDYGKSKPRDGELIKQAITRLERAFGDNLIVETTSAEETRLDGKRALALFFTGSRNTVDWVGKCYALTHHGFGYWVFMMQTIGGNVQQDLAEKLLTELQSRKDTGFHTNTDRRGWIERAPDMLTLKGESAPVQLRVPAGQWRKFQARDVDELGEIYAHSKETRKFNLEHEKEASILVSRINQKAPDLTAAVQAAQDYVQTRKKLENEAFRISPLKDAKSQKNLPAKVGNQPGQVVELQMESDDKAYKKYILLGVVQRPDHVYFVQCESFWQYRQAWRGDFLDIISTFSLKE